MELARAQLQQDNKHTYAFLVSEDSVRTAIRSAIASYDARIDDLERQFPGVGMREIWIKSKPIFLKIVASGEWPRGCSFTADYGLTDNHATYEGLLLRLQTSHDISQRAEFPNIDLLFGHAD